MKKRLPVWAICLVFVLATAALSYRFWVPVTEDSGQHYTLVLESTRSTDKFIKLYFNGYGDYFQLARDAVTEPLLSPKAIGQEYEIIARRHHQRRGNDYYMVYALTGPDGTVYRSLEESEEARLKTLPLRAALLVGLDIIACAAIVYGEHKRAAAAAAHAKEVSS